MKIIENKNGLFIISPESPEFIIYSKLNNTYHKTVILGKNDSPDNYKEMRLDTLEEANDNKKIQELLDRIERQDALISKLAEQLAELSNLVNKK